MDNHQNTTPQMCGHFSVSSDRNYKNDASLMRYFKLPSVPLNLNTGLENTEEKSDQYFNEKMDNLLRYIVNHRVDMVNPGNGEPLIPFAKYITYRGVIRSIMCSPYDNRRGWVILASKYKGNIYLCPFTSAEDREISKNEPFSKKKFALYGYKFEQYCLSVSISYQAMNMDKHQSTSPQMCGYFSVSSDRNYKENASALNYFKRPRVPLNLNTGIKSTEEKSDRYFNEKMDNLLRYIVNHRADMVNPGNGEPLIPFAKYITYRGVIRSIMCSPYDNRRGWVILASKYKGNIYLCPFTSAEDREISKNEPFSKKKFALYGYKFEQYCLSDDPSLLPDTSVQVDGSSQFFGVFKRMLVGRSFLFAGEMDGVVSNTKLDLNKPTIYKDLKFIELKVAVYPYNSKLEENFAKIKCPNVWTQSFLTGVQDIYFGLRDNNGIVNEIKHYNLNELKTKWEKYWHPSKCFDFLADFLTRVENELKNVECPYTVYAFKYNEKTRKISHEIHAGRTDYTLLTDWYLDGMNS